MATLKHIAWVGAFLIANMMQVACVLAEHGNTAAGRCPGKGACPPLELANSVIKPPAGSGTEAINVTAFLNGGDALEAQPQPQPPTRICIRFYQQFCTGTQVKTVGPVGPNNFGRIDVFEVRSTRMPDPKSTTIGFARGVLFYDNREFSAYENKWTLTFTRESGFPTNSSLHFEGFQPDTSVFGQPYNYSVVGGTGAFACAKGVVTESTYFSSDNLQTVEDIAYMVVGCGVDPYIAIDLFSSQPKAGAFT